MSNRPVVPSTDFSDQNDLAKRISALERILATVQNNNMDSVQQGVVGAGDFNSTGITVAADGSITATMAAGACWVLGTNGLLTRSVITAPITGSGKPATLPATGLFSAYAIDYIPGANGYPGQLVIDSRGADQATFAAALNAPAPLVVGRMRVRDKVVQNSTGTTYVDAGTSRDRRPWANGGEGLVTLGASVGGPGGSFTQVTGCQVRLECGGGLVHHKFDCYITQVTSGAVVNFLFTTDGGGVGGQHSWTAPVASSAVTMGFDAWTTPSQGSHLFGLAWNNTGTPTIVGTGGYTPVMEISEVMRPNANNGSS